MKNKGIGGIVTALIICAVTAGILAGTFWGFLPYYYKNMYIAPVPTGLSSGQEASPSGEVSADYYVSAAGSDAADGTAEHPFATIQRAKIEVRMMDKKDKNHVVVSVKAGTYDAEEISFSKEDSGTNTCSVNYCAYGDGETILRCKNGVVIDSVKNFNFSGFTVKDSEKDGITVKASEGVSVSYCKVLNCAGIGIKLAGIADSVTECIVSHTGSNGIVIGGGNAKNQSISGNSVTNCLISNAGETQAGEPAVILGGIGNSLRYNEIYNTAYSAIKIRGNQNAADYNYIHNCVLSGDEIAAITSDFGWDSYGNFIRYNCISTLGDGKSKPDGIKACSGTTVQSNLIVNAPGTGIDFNGGRDITATGNVIVNSANAFLCGKPREDDESIAQAVVKLNKTKRSDVAYSKALPLCSALETDPEKAGDTAYILNAAGNKITDNIVLQHKAELGLIEEYVRASGTIENNACFKLNAKNVFEDYDNGVYLLAENSSALPLLKDFSDIPVSEIGRY